jgi:hypothetical protein
MNSFEIYSDNLIYQSKITANSENAQFPLSNILDPRRSKVYRSTSSQTALTLDFNETSEVDAFMIVDDKKNGFGIHTITLEFNGTNEWSNPAASEQIEFNPQLGLGFKEFTKHSYRFCRIVLTSTLSYCEIANIFIGKKMELNRSINFGWSIKDNELSNKTTNRYGQIFTDVILKQKTINCGLSFLDKDQLDKIFTWLDTYGETMPFFVRIGCDNMVSDNRRFSGMVYLSDMPTISNPYFNKYNLSMTLIEAT